MKVSELVEVKLAPVVEETVPGVPIPPILLREVEELEDDEEEEEEEEAVPVIQRSEEPVSMITLNF